MKLMMFAALAAAVAMPAIAQTAPDSAGTASTSGQAVPPPADPSTMTTTTTTTSTTTDTPAPMASPMPADGAYPMCSHTVTDHCTERSNAKGARLHSTPRG